MSEKLSEMAFIQALSRDFDWELPPSVDAELIGELGFDSFDFVRLVVSIEEIAGLAFPFDDEDLNLSTLRDAYAYYVVARAAALAQADQTP